MTIKNPKGVHKTIIIIFLVTIIVLSAVFDFYQYNRFQRRNLITTYKSNIASIISKNHSNLSIKDVSMIDTWMTFGYINTIFKLPSDYLKTSLNINDNHYPNLSLNKYINTQKLDKNVYLSSVRSSVANYFMKK